MSCMILGCLEYYYVMHLILPFFIFMHLGSEEEITLLEFDEVEEEDQQENPQAAAPEGKEQTPEELPECPDHRPTSFLKGKPRSILSLPMFYKIILESFMIDALGYRSCLETLDARMLRPSLPFGSV